MKNMSTAEQWVVELFDGCSEAFDVLYDIQTARDDLEMFRRDYGEVPEDLTPEILMQTWNRLVLKTYKTVELPDGSKEYRYNLMSNKEIAEAIDESYDWGYVEDLVEYVNDNFLHLVFTGDWESAIETWCEEQ